MTDEEILATADACGMMLFGLGMDKAKFEFCLLAFAKQIAKLDRHHEREALAQTQEPVALPTDEYFVTWSEQFGGIGFKESMPNANYKITVTAVPQRTWVDLTRTQMQDVYFAVLEEHRGGHQMQGQLAFAEALQAKIKERNT